MPDIKEELAVEVADASLEVIRRFFKLRGTITEKELIKARMASTTFGAIVKYKQHQSNMSAVKVAVATQILETPADRELYLRLSAPELQLNKIKESKLLAAGIKPEEIQPKDYTVDLSKGYVENAEKAE